jgi:hypothetical protein
MLSAQEGHTGDLSHLVTTVTLPDVGNPYSVSELQHSLKTVHRASMAFFNSISTETFFARFGDAWSPAENVRHLTKSVRPVAKALRIPRMALAVLFGVRVRRSMDYLGVRETYRRRLAAGGKAGRFTPAPERVTRDPEARRATIMSDLDSAIASLTAAAEMWRERPRTLDRLRLPHPLLGWLTIREMLMFTAYHNWHHPNIVIQRLNAARAEARLTTERARRP